MEKNVNYLYKKTKLILDSQKNIVIVTNGHQILEANKAFLDFFKTNSLEEFLENASCICDYFIQSEGERYLKKIDQSGKNWADVVIGNPESIHKAMVLDKNGMEHIFEVSGQKLQLEGIDDEDVIVFTDITRVEQQRVMISNMEIPILQMTDGLMMIPLIGLLDSTKSQKLMENILFEIKVKEVKVIIIDIQGISMMDSAVAAHIVKITKATKLMGCEAIVSGISPEVAQTIVNLGINVENMRTTSNLKDAIKLAFKSIKFEIAE